MKVYEISRIGVGSVFRFNFVVGLVVGLLTSIVLLITGASLQNIGIQLGTIAPVHGGPLQIGAALVGVILASLAYGLFMGITGAITALIYNLFAGATGGITVKVKE